MNLNCRELFKSLFVQPLHRFLIARGRARAIGGYLQKLLEEEAPLQGVDVGCGSGEITRLVESLCPHVRLTGVDVVADSRAFIPVTLFEGKNLPFDDESFDFTLLIDVLHHTDEPASLLKECLRISRSFIVIKDHYCKSSWDRIRLRVMDYVGNPPHIPVPADYLSEEGWRALFEGAGIGCDTLHPCLRIYSFPFSILFNDTLHFIARLKKKEP